MVIAKVEMAKAEMVHLAKLGLDAFLRRSTAFCGYAYSSSPTTAWTTTVPSCFFQFFRGGLGLTKVLSFYQNLKWQKTAGGSC